MFSSLTHKNILLLLSLLLISNIGFAQKTKISKIIDANLFELANGQLIKLANIDVPNINNKNLKLQAVAVEAYKFAKDNLYGKNFSLIYPLTNSTDTNYALVYIIRKYPLITIDFTERYLQNGFGKFITNVNNNSDSSKYLLAEQEAQEDKKGIWDIKNNFNDTLDQTFLGQKLLSENAIDSIKVPYSHSALFTNISTPSRIFIETMASPIFGIIGGFLGTGAGLAASSIAGAKDLAPLGYAIISISVGYLTGCSLGTYLVAKGGNRDVSYGYTLLSSVMGAISGIYLSSKFDGFHKASVFSYAPLAMPVIATIIYSNLIAPKKEQSQYSVSYNQTQLPVRNYFTHNDFYNSTKLIEVDLIKISF